MVCLLPCRVCFFVCVTICRALSLAAVGSFSLCSPVGLLVVLSASYLCLADSAPIRRHSLPGKSFLVSFSCSAREGAKGRTDARCDDERFNALCLSIPSCKIGKIAPSLNFGGFKFVIVHKSRSCCRNAYLCVCVFSLITCLKNYHCSGLGFAPRLFFFIPYS